MADLVGVGRIIDRSTFAEHAAPEAVRAHLDAARRRAAHANGEVRWLERLLAAKTERLPHTHVCVSCSPGGVVRGPGCINCRHTGMDQTPCLADGHQPHCPAGCCDQQRDDASSDPSDGGAA